MVHCSFVIRASDSQSGIDLLPFQVLCKFSHFMVHQSSLSCMNEYQPINGGPTDSGGHLYMNSFEHLLQICNVAECI